MIIFEPCFCFVFFFPPDLFRFLFCRFLFRLCSETFFLIIFKPVISFQDFFVFFSTVQFLLRFEFIISNFPIVKLWIYIYIVYFFTFHAIFKVRSFFRFLFVVFEFSQVFSKSAISFPKRIRTKFNQTKNQNDGQSWREIRIFSHNKFRMKIFQNSSENASNMQTIQSLPPCKCKIEVQKNMKQTSQQHSTSSLNFMWFILLIFGLNFSFLILTSMIGIQYKRRSLYRIVLFVSKCVAQKFSSFLILFDIV